jgi:hypothetical protein
MPMMTANTTVVVMGPSLRCGAEVLRIGQQSAILWWC